MSKHRLTGTGVIASEDIYVEESVAKHAYGHKGYAENGDIYRYTRIISTGTDLIAGNLLTALGNEANHQNVALSASAAVGDTLVIPTMGATIVDANEYDQGWLIFNDVSPEGEAYKIESHEANAGSLATDVTLERGIRTAATTSSEVELVRNPWNNPAISQLLVTQPAGVAMQDWDVSVANHGWLKTRGYASVLVDSTGITTGFAATVSNQVDGSVGLFSDVDQEQVVGWMMATGTATEFNSVYLVID